MAQVHSQRQREKRLSGVSFAVVGTFIVCLLGAQLTPLAGAGEFPLVVLCIVLSLNAVYLRLLRDRAAPKRAQKRYVEASQLREASLIEQQILALDAISDYRFGCWNSTLATGPIWRELPERVRRRGEETNRSPWPGIEMQKASGFQTWLDEQQGVVGAYDLRVRVAQFLDDPPISRAFRTSVEAGDVDLGRLASLVDRVDVAFLTPSTVQHPALLGRDTVLIHQIIRFGYCAGYLDAGEAWELLASATRPAFERFRSYDEYYENVLLGTAFMANSLSAVQKERKALNELKSSRWPAASTPWPAVDRMEGLKHSLMPPHA